jgi:hypothetical protein
MSVLWKEEQTIPAERYFQLQVIHVAQELREEEPLKELSKSGVQLAISSKHDE